MGMSAVLVASLLLAAVIPTNNTQQPRELGAFYFDALDQSQVWTTLEPAAADAGARSVFLNFTVAFPGRKLAGKPDVVTVRAQANGMAFPNRIRQPVLAFRGAGREYALTAPGRVYDFTASCEKCSNDTVSSRMAFDELVEMVHAPAVSVDALGFELTLTAADLAAIQRLIDAVKNGAVVK
jgi:hypothetical protein